jgi:hypothetical protein
MYVTDCISFIIYLAIHDNILVHLLYKGCPPSCIDDHSQWWARCISNQIISISKHGKPNKLRVFVINTPKGLNRIDKIGYGRLYMRQFLWFPVNIWSKVSIRPYYIWFIVVNQLIKRWHCLKLYQKYSMFYFNPDWDYRGHCMWHIVFLKYLQSLLLPFSGICGSVYRTFLWVELIIKITVDMNSLIWTPIIRHNYLKYVPICISHVFILCMEQFYCFAQSYCILLSLFWG